MLKIRSGRSTDGLEELHLGRREWNGDKAGEMVKILFTQVLFSPGKEIRTLLLRKQEIDYLMFYFAFDKIYLCGGNRLKNIKLSEVDKLW